MLMIIYSTLQFHLRCLVIFHMTAGDGMLNFLGGVLRICCFRAMTVAITTGHKLASFFNNGHIIIQYLQKLKIKSLESQNFFQD